MENDDDSGGGGDTVSPDDSGEGLPYAPVDWPNPGDNWTWRVGHRLSKKGTLTDRFLRVPPRLRKRPDKVLEFASKPAVERYLRSEFPDADITAFFASFTWEIRVKPEFMQQGKNVCCSSLAHSQVKELKKNRVGGNGCTNLSIDNGEETTSSPLQVECPIDCKQVEINNLLIGLQGEPSPEEFDRYLKSLDEIILNAVHQSSSKDQVMMVDIRKKLSSLLAMGMDRLLSSDHVNDELMALTCKLQNDPSLEAEELSMLELIHSVPFISKAFLEAKQVSSKADKFFDELNAKIASVTSFKEKYTATKEEIEAIQAEEAFAVLDIMNIDQDISNLEKKRQAKFETIRANSKKRIHLTSIQTSVMKSLPKLVEEVQIARSEKLIWELKKKKAVEKEVEILRRFALLGRYSF